MILNEVFLEQEQVGELMNSTLLRSLTDGRSCSTSKWPVVPVGIGLL